MTEESDANGTSRGQFLARAAGVTGMVVGAGVWAGAAAAQEVAEPEAAAAAGTGRSFSAARFALELDNVSSGFVQSAAGGATFADVIEEGGSDYYPRKHLGQPKYEDFTLQIGTTMNRGVYEWIQATWQNAFQRRNGALIATDAQQNAVSRREFFEALITETTIPAMDASSKDPAYMTLKFAPELARTTKTSGKLTEAKSTQKSWLPSNFRLEIDGLDATKVNKIEALTIKQKVVTDPIGEERDFEREPTKIEFPDLVVTLAESSSQTWFDWFEDFVVRGNNGQEEERGGKLTFLASNLKDELGHVTFFNLGIFKIGGDKAEANADAIKRITAELYCERMELQIGSGALA